MTWGSDWEENERSSTTPGCLECQRMLNSDDSEMEPSGAGLRNLLYHDMLRNVNTLAETTCPVMMKNLKQLLDKEDSTEISNQIIAQDKAKNVIRLLFHLYDGGLMADKGGQNASKKGRRLVLKLGTGLRTIPDSLILNSNDIEILTRLPLEVGGFGVVHKATFQGATVVALKFCFFARNSERDLCREALAWKTLSHKYILPLIGIYMNEAQTFMTFVTPWMENGTFINWRKNMNPCQSELKRCMLEVAEGLQYLHREGLVHGDLKGNNVVLDSEFHVKLIDFGLTRHLDGTATKNSALSYHFAAPELLLGGETNTLLKRTDKTDVYAFGCLYYEIHYGRHPFGNCNELYIVAQVKRGIRPPRLPTPPMDQQTWALIQRSWLQDPRERPTIGAILDEMHR